VFLTVTVVNLVVRLKRLVTLTTLALSNAFGVSFFTFLRLLAFCLLDLKVDVFGFLDPSDVGGERLLCPDRRAGVAMARVEDLPPAAFGGGVMVVLAATAMLFMAVASSITSSIASSMSPHFPLIA